MAHGPATTPSAGRPTSHPAGDASSHYRWGTARTHAHHPQHICVPDRCSGQQVRCVVSGAMAGGS